MKILIANDFFRDWELIEVPDIETAELYIRTAGTGAFTGSLRFLDCSETRTTIEEAKAEADHILFTTDYIED